MNCFLFVESTMAPRSRANRGADDVNAPMHFGIRMDTDDFDAAFRANARRPMELTRFFEEKALQALGLYDEVKRLFDNIRWGALVTNSWRTYHRVTIEVVTSMRIKHHRK